MPITPSDVLVGAKQIRDTVIIQDIAECAKIWLLMEQANAIAAGGGGGGGTIQVVGGNGPPSSPPSNPSLYYLYVDENTQDIYQWQVNNAVWK